jgi:hypothetical protein
MFRFGNGHIAAYCEFHGMLKARQSGVRLPEPQMKEAAKVLERRLA